MQCGELKIFLCLCSVKALFQKREEFSEPCSLNIVGLVRGEYLRWP